MRSKRSFAAPGSSRRASSTSCSCSLALNSRARCSKLRALSGESGRRSTAARCSRSRRMNGRVCRSASGSCAWMRPAQSHRSRRCGIALRGSSTSSIARSNARCARRSREPMHQGTPRARMSCSEKRTSWQRRGSDESQLNAPTLGCEGTVLCFNGAQRAVGRACNTRRYPRSHGWFLAVPVRVSLSMHQGATSTDQTERILRRYGCLRMFAPQLVPRSKLLRCRLVVLLRLDTHSRALLH